MPGSPAPLPFPTRARVHRNLGPAPLIEQAVRRGEGLLSKDGALVVETGRHTGRSAKDKFIVRDEVTEEAVWWGRSNQPMDPAHFAQLKADFLAALAEREELFVQDLFGGAEPAYRLPVQVVTELAWHALFIRTLLVRPTAADLAHFTPDYRIINLPSFRADPRRHGCHSDTVIAVSFRERLILIGGTKYAGEMKKAVFGVLNFLLPERGVMPMHCSANMGPRRDTAVFFGLSGTGKTTLSADSRRTLIGDDEHGWSDTAVFNFEGGCYAKVIRLSPEAEPEIHATTRRFGTILENVVIDPLTREIDLDDARITENTRGSYPLDFIPNSAPDAMGPPARHLVMLAADAFGILPPIARLTPEQAMYHFLSGYTARVAGTELGVTEPEATFSTCFGAPFMPRHPTVYGNLLRDRIARGRVDCWLVNTGWTGGPYGVGRRMPIQVTRALLHAALEGALADVPYRRDPFFGFQVPIAVPGVDPALLDPRATWPDPAAYDRQAARLVGMFVENFAEFAHRVEADVLRAAPRAA